MNRLVLTMSSFRKIILFLVSVKLAFVKLEPNSREIEPGLIDRISFHTKFLSFSDIMNFLTSDRVKDDPKGKILCMTFWCNYDIVMTSWIIELWCHDDFLSKSVWYDVIMMKLIYWKVGKLIKYGPNVERNAQCGNGIKKNAKIASRKTGVREGLI